MEMLMLRALQRKRTHFLGPVDMRQRHAPGLAAGIARFRAQSSAQALHALEARQFQFSNLERARKREHVTGTGEEVGRVFPLQPIDLLGKRRAAVQDDLRSRLVEHAHGPTPVRLTPTAGITGGLAKLDLGALTAEIAPVPDLLAHEERELHEPRHLADAWLNRARTSVDRHLDDVTVRRRNGPAGERVTLALHRRRVQDRQPLPDLRRQRLAWPVA